MSNKKTLLNEGTIRRFMKLANIDGLAEIYLDRFEVNEGDKEDKEEEVKEEGMYAAKEDDEVKKEGMYAAKEDEEVEEGMYAAKEDDEQPAMKDLDEEEMGMDKMDMDAEAEEGHAEEGGADEAMVKELVTAIANAVEKVSGVGIDVEGGGGEAEEVELDAPEEEGGEELDLDMGVEMGDEEPAKHDGPMMEDEDFDAYIAEVTRRVAKRIIKKKISK